MDLKERENPKSGYPSLVDIGQRRERDDVSNIISNGKGMMPGFSSITGTEKQALIAFLFGDERVEAASTSDKKKGPFVPYKFNGYNKFLDSKGYPAISPPWGTLTAIDLNTGKHVWQKTLGEFKELTAKGNTPTGTENYGGPVVTAGGILFIAATKDGMFRAFDKKSGKLLWQTELPAAGFATPSTYEVNGKQFVVVACGGTKLGTKKGIVMWLLRYHKLNLINVFELDSVTLSGFWIRLGFTFCIILSSLRDCLKYQNNLCL